MLRMVLVLGFAFAFAATGCSTPGSSNPCKDDQNGVSGGSQVILLTVSDTSFSVGAPDAGPGEPNITVENSATVTLTMTNVGTKPHDFVIQCAPTPNAIGCPAQSCFPANANLPPVMPGQSATTTFVAPFPEGAYPFISDVAGDTQLVGQFVLM